MCIEREISDFMLKMSKFEFFLINQNIELGRVEQKGTLQKITGIEWEKLATMLERKYKFQSFDFHSYKFFYFISNVPQYLVRSDRGELKWDSDDVTVDSWSKLLIRGYAQFRNNVAHGNKAHLASQFTEGRTKEFLAASQALIDFIAAEIFNEPCWDRSIFFKS